MQSSYYCSHFIEKIQGQKGYHRQVSDRSVTKPRWGIIIFLTLYYACYCTSDAKEEVDSNYICFFLVKSSQTASPQVGSLSAKADVHSMQKGRSQEDERCKKLSCASLVPLPGLDSSLAPHPWRWVNVKAEEEHFEGESLLKREERGVGNNVHS